MAKQTMSEMKRVYCLYRVSTIGQVEKDDIPMQKQCCREFALRQGWSIEAEFYEKGVSGFKLSAKERDKVLEIQQAAIEGKFDILLVFMFDRLGRRDDETPFVVEWFVRNGIEVWSAMEGQQRFDNHVDKLLNYIRYWQASGESIKTSLRVKTRMEQLTQEGHFTGGGIPYGYRIEKRGRTNKRNVEVNDMVIDPEAAQIVKLIFNKYVNEGYGAQRLSRYLSENKICRADGSNFPNTSINRMIKNPIYTGVIHNGDAISEEVPELRIIDRDTYDRAQTIMQSRTQQHSDIPLNLKGSALLVGKVYCGHCGNRLTLTTSGKRKTCIDGSVQWVSRPRYQCHYKVRHPDSCDGQSGYGVPKLDAIVDQVIRSQLEKIKGKPGEDIVTAQHKKMLELTKTRMNLCSSRLSAKCRELEDYRSEILRVIRGESRFTADMLNELIEQGRAEERELSETLRQIKEEYSMMQSGADREEEELSRLRSWADVYDSCSFEAKKMFIAYFVKSIHVHRDYELDIQFNVSFEEFRNLSYSPDDRCDIPDTKIS